MGIITTTLKPQKKTDVVGIAVLNPEDFTIQLDCLPGRDWESTKDFTGLTAETYHQAVRTEEYFKETLNRLRGIPVVTFAKQICCDALELFGIPGEYLIQLPSAYYVVSSSMTPWERLEENPNIVEWVRYLNRYRVATKRQELLDAVKAKRSDKRLYGITCLDNLETDATIWEAILNMPC